MYLPDLVLIGSYYGDWFERGEGVGNFMSYGDFVSRGDGGPMASAYPWRRNGRNVSEIHPLDLDDAAQVRESVAHSWYRYSNGSDAGLHPMKAKPPSIMTGQILLSIIWTPSVAIHGSRLRVGVDMQSKSDRLRVSCCSMPPGIRMRRGSRSARDNSPKSRVKGVKRLSELPA